MWSDGTVRTMMGLTITKEIVSKLRTAVNLTAFHLQVNMIGAWCLRFYSIIAVRTVVDVGAAVIVDVGFAAVVELPRSSWELCLYQKFTFITPGCRAFLWEVNCMFSTNVIPSFMCSSIKHFLAYQQYASGSSKRFLKQKSESESEIKSQSDDCIVS
ncbi:hypothetical protein RRG08_003624 [Elysia crispata]|uniref:Uncharacterized protein n=1 Tax=Elysia crispata TaxID=231223 RepID=A0AAE1AWB3_9GAST|nr:hypothetical protein RRG08_003624 [Elysia crispata]